VINKNIIRGQFVKFDVGGTRVTQALRDALVILDEECRWGSGGTWDISREGRKIVATPVDGPFDSLVFNRKKGKWDVL
jgi:hypothetical protein